MLYRVRFCLVLGLLGSALSAFAGDAQWVEVRSPNFSVITDAGDKRGRQTALRFEQMRMAYGKLMNKGTVNIPVPLQIIAFRNTKEMRQFVPLWKGKPIQLAGLFQGSEDRCFILLDMLSEDPWRVVFHEYGHQLLNGNISFRVQPWFDEGFAEFFSTIQASDKRVDVGKASDEDVQVLTQNHLMKVSDLFQVKQQSSTYNETGDRRYMFYAESWLVVHYIYDNHIIPKLGTYFDLALAQGKPVDEAIQQAFGMSPAEFDKALEKYFQGGRLVYYPVPMPEGFDGSNYTVKPIEPLNVRAVLADVHLHSPDYGDLAMQEFEGILKEQPDNQAALRGMGYAYLRKSNFQQAGDYFDKAVKADSNDPRVLYYSAVLAQQSGGLSSDPDRMATAQKQLEKSISLDPNFADSYGVLAYVFMSEGKPEQAVPVLSKAISLNPRNEHYSLNLAQLYMMQRKYDDAIALLQQLSKSPEAYVALAAARELETVQSMKQMAASGNAVQFQIRRGPPSGGDTVTTTSTGPTTPVAPVAVGFLKGKLLSVDCSNPPAADLTVAVGLKTWKLHVKDRAHALVIGADNFSCEWVNQKIAVNYRKSGDTSGDIVSIEVQ